MRLNTQHSAKTYLERVENLETLKPCEETNQVLSGLVNDIIEENISEKELEVEEIHRLRKICGEAEFELEKQWAEKIIESENPRQKIRDFPYYENYVKLAEFEYSTLVGCCNDIKKNAVFVGGGPLPMTALTFAKHYGFDITVMDRSQEAVEKSRKLLEALNINGKVIESSAEEFTDFREYDIIHVASMVGTNKEEELEVFKKIKSQLDKHTHIIGRTVHGNRRLLYRPVSNKVKEMFKVEAERRPSTDIVNSTTVMSIN